MFRIWKFDEYNFLFKKILIINFVIEMRFKNLNFEHLHFFNNISAFNALKALANKVLIFFNYNNYGKLLKTHTFFFLG